MTSRTNARSSKNLQLLVFLDLDRNRVTVEEEYIVGRIIFLLGLPNSMGLPEKYRR
jgi:hypothetical protein